MNFQIRLANSKDLGQLIKFFNRVYGRGHIMTNPKYLTWQYQGAAFNDFYPEYPNLLLLKNKEIVGHLGLIPYKMMAGGQELRAGFLASLIAAEDLRGSGAGIFLIKEAEKYFDVLYTTGFKREIAPIFKFCGWHEEKTLHRWTYLLGQEKRLAGLPVRDISRFAGAGNEVLNCTELTTIKRTAAYLNWRFTDHPLIKYKIFVFGDTYSSGYLVLRKEVGPDWRAVRIVDFFSGPKGRGALLAAAKNYGAAEKADFIDFFCSTLDYGESLLAAGFQAYQAAHDADPPVFILPTDRHRRVINFSFKFIHEENNLTKEWFVVKSDGDKDRP